MQRGHYQALLPDFAPMIEPTLNYVPCPGPAAASAPATHADAAAAQHRMAYWEWNATGNPAHPMWWCVCTAFRDRGGTLTPWRAAWSATHA